MTDETIRVSKTAVFFALGVLVLVGLSVYLLTRDSGAQQSSPSNELTGAVQTVVLGVKGTNYYPQTIRVQAGSPVRISLDESVVGCLRSFTIPALRIAKNLRTPADYVEFTPTTKGTYRFACSMGMGTGTLIVA